jgi:hypothetical protein
MTMAVMKFYHPFCGAKRAWSTSVRQQKQSLVCMLATRSNSSSARSQSTLLAIEGAANARHTVPRTELWKVFTTAAVPMAGFGFMDQTVMLQAGHVIDCTLGVAFGLSTLTAAAFGQVCSDASGVLFGGTLERLASNMGLRKANLTTAQRLLPVVQRTKLLGALGGVIFGCCLGLANLLFIDTKRSSTLKLQALNEEQEFEFQVEASNEIPGVTTLTVRGPDVDGILASMTAALAVQGCSLIELHAKRLNEEDSHIHDVFSVVHRDTNERFDDDDLPALAQALLEATKTPMNHDAVQALTHDLERTVQALRSRVHKLEKVLRDKQIQVVPRSSSTTEMIGQET